MIALLPDGGLGRHLYLEGLKFGNDLLFQGIVNTSKELLVDLTACRFFLIREAFGNS